MNHYEWIGPPSSWTDWTAIGLLVFTAAQVGLAVYNEKRARRERAANERQRVEERFLDKKQREREAYGALYVEWLRISTIADYWQRIDIVETVALGFFDPSEIMPRDWSGSATRLAMLGRLTAEFGAAAYTLLERAETCGKRVKQNVALIAAGYPKFPHDMDAIFLRNPDMTAAAKRFEVQAKQFAREAVLLFNDALENSAPGKEPALYEPMVSAESAQGKAFREKLNAGKPASFDDIMPKKLD